MFGCVSLVVLGDDNPFEEKRKFSCAKPGRTIYVIRSHNLWVAKATGGSPNADSVEPAHEQSLLHEFKSPANGRWVSWVSFLWELSGVAGPLLCDGLQAGER